MRLLLKAVAFLVVLYLLTIGTLFALMRQPPDLFSKVMAKMPGPMLMVLPFQKLWLAARAGRLNIGDAAPDFDLATLDHNSRVRLSSLRGQKPVVLVFGSYT